MANHACNGCEKEFDLSKLHIDEGDSLLCDDCFLKMMNSCYGTNFESLEEAGYVKIQDSWVWKVD